MIREVLAETAGYIYIMQAYAKNTPYTPLTNEQLECMKTYFIKYITGTYIWNMLRHKTR